MCHVRSYSNLMSLRLKQSNLEKQKKKNLKKKKNKIHLNKRHCRRVDTLNKLRYVIIHLLSNTPTSSNKIYYLFIYFVKALSYK